MKFVCDGCQTRYSIADEKVRQRILRIRCKTCGHVITVQSGEVVPGPQDFSGRAGSDAGPSAGAAARPSAGLSRASASAREWFVAVDGKGQGPLNCTDAAKVIVSLKPEQSVHVWKDGMDGWKRPSDVAIIAQEISVLRRSPLEAPPVVTSSVLRPAPARADSVPRVRAPGSRPQPLPTGSAGSGPKPAQPSSGVKAAPVSGSGPKVAPPPLPGSGPKAVPPALSGSAPKAVPPALSGSAPKAAPPAIAGSGPKAVPPPIPGSQPKTRPSVSAQLVTAGSSSPSLKKGPALPGVTPMSSGHSAPEAEFEEAPATKPEKRPSAPLAVVAPGAPVAATGQPTAPRDGTADDEFDQAQKTPPSGHPLPPIVAQASDGHAQKPLPTASSAGVHPPVLPQPPIRPSSLFGNVALAPPEPWKAPEQSGLSKLAALTRRHRHLKYAMAASAVVVLVILVILASWKADSGKAATAVSQPPVHAPQVAPVVEVEPLPQGENSAAPGAEPKGRTAPRAARRPAAVHSAGSSAKAAAADDDPFEGPSPASHSTERPAPVVAPDQSRRSHSGPSGGAVREVSQSQISEVVRNKENQAGLKTCYERALKRDSRLRAGRLDITVSIGVSGVVQGVQVHGPSDFLIIEDCIKNAVRHWHFPANVDEYGTSFPLIMQGG